MKKITLFLATLFLLVNFTNAQNVKPTFEKLDGFTKATYYYDNGSIKEIGYFKNEKLQGKWVSYNSDGKITAIANYEKGLKNGTWFVVSKDTIKELTYKKNKLINVKNSDKTELSII